MIPPVGDSCAFPDGVGRGCLLVSAGVWFWDGDEDDAIDGHCQQVLLGDVLGSLDCAGSRSRQGERGEVCGRTGR